MKLPKKMVHGVPKTERCQDELEDYDIFHDIIHQRGQPRLRELLLCLFWNVSKKGMATKAQGI